MTREEAAQVIKDRINDELWKQENGIEVFPITMDAFRVAIAALRGPTPDPDTGLVPCGCGGKAEFAGCSGDADYYSIVCAECAIDTDSYASKDDAKAAWNRAMGYKA